MNKLCSWCKHLIKPNQVFVTRTVNLPNGGRFEYRYHAGLRQPCYSAWMEFMALHSFLPLCPETHDHE